MPKLKAKKNENEVYDTKGLNEAQFMMAFNRIQQEQKNNRRSAKRTLTPTSLKRRTTQDLVKLGKKADGTPFTTDDLKRFEKLSKKYKKRRGSLTGISFLEVVSKGRAIDIKRANNQSTDGLGISRASLIAFRKNNTAFVRVKASSKSKHQEHMVKVRFEEWDDCLQNATPTIEGYTKAVKAACKGRVSFDCDCGRYQYWYRYLATIGHYQLSPPKELAFPKIRNPNLVGVACKHITKALTMLQSPAWHRPLAAQMKQQARAIGFGDDELHGKIFTKDDIKKANKNRKLTVNQDKARAEYKRYINRLSAMKKKLKENPEMNKKIRDQLKRVKAANKKTEADNKRLKGEVKKLQQQAKSQAKDLMKVKLHTYLDAMKDAGLSESQGVKAFAKKTGLSVAAVAKLKMELDK